MLSRNSNIHTTPTLHPVPQPNHSHFLALEFPSRDTSSRGTG
uniref:Uncharacterized protein n=1 Tax=Trichinella nativa TaxID=6335 RepID=A0A0V1K7M4_9BILA